MSKTVRNQILTLILTLVFTTHPSRSLFGQELPLKEVINKVFTHNPTIFRLISDSKAISSLIRRNKGLYDWSASIAYNYADLDQTRTVIFQPSKIKRRTAEAGISKYFKTGTQLDIDSSIIREKDDSTFNIFNTRYNSELGISISQSLLDGFLGQPNRIILLTDQMRVDALKHSLWRDLEILAADSTHTYWELWREIQLEKIADENVQEALAFLKETQRLARRGLREKDEILQAETAWLERKQEKLTTQTRKEIRWVELKTKMGVNGNRAWIEIPTLESPIWKPALEDGEMLKEAYQRRGDYLAADLDQQLNEKLKTSTNWKKWPALTASGGYSFLGLDPNLDKSIQQVRKTEIKGWNIGMALQHSFGQNTDRADIDLAESNEYRARSLLKEIGNRVEQQVVAGVRQLKLTHELFDIAKQIEDKKQKIEKAFKRKFNQGRISIQDLLQSQNERRRARSQRQITEAKLALEQLNTDLAHGTFLEDLGYSHRDPFQILESHP